MNAVVIYWSKTGNTARVARAIEQGLADGGAAVEVLEVDDAADVDWMAYDLVCIGAPSYRWRPPSPMDAYLTAQFNAYRKERGIKVGALPVPGKQALVFVTYSGQHTALREAVPAALVIGQYLEHVGIPVVEEWYVVGEYHGSEEASTLGRLGDIRGRPNAQDLAKVRADAADLARRLG